MSLQEHSTDDVSPHRDVVARRVSIAAGTLLGVAAVFGAGVHFANEQYWPFKPVAKAIEVLEEVAEYGALAPENALGDAPENASREPFTVHVPDRAASGYRAVMGYLSERGDFAIWIYDAQGNRVHERVLDYASQDPDGPTGGSEAPHAFHFLADGSVVVNTDKGDVMTRYDACGEPLWTRHGSFHHSLAADPEGGVWTWRGETSAFDQYQYLVRFDPISGDTLEQIGLVEEIMAASPENRTIFTLVQGHDVEHADGYRSVQDLFHPNDLEVLGAEHAAAFPQFKIGDLLMSFRNIDLVAVVDRDSYAIKWWSHGPWIQQHDPDFSPGGEITVFNNNGWRRTSSIIGIEPGSRAVREAPIEKKQRFYTQYMGKHQYFDDGTLQVVVPFEGRVLEFDPEGRLLVEINNIHSKKHNAFVADATLLADDFFDIAPENFTCHSNQIIATHGDTAHES